MQKAVFLFMFLFHVINFMRKGAVSYISICHLNDKLFSHEYKNVSKLNAKLHIGKNEL